MKFIEIEYPRRKDLNIRIFLFAFGASILGIGVNYLLFPSQGTISVFLTAFALMGLVKDLFEQNKHEIWDNIVSPYHANSMLAFSLLSIFLGILIGYSLVTTFMSPHTTIQFLDEQLGAYKSIRPGYDISLVDFGSFRSILYHNLVVLLIVLFFALLYRAGGMLLIIAWNASVWGVTFSYIAHHSVLNDSMVSGMFKRITILVMIYFSVFLHLITESLGYILCAMTGLFISKASIKYFRVPNRFFSVTKASFLIFLLSFLLILVAAFIESNVTPQIINFLFQSRG